jgi:hypothetical protein
MTRGMISTEKQNTQQEEKNKEGGAGEAWR